MADNFPWLKPKGSIAVEVACADERREIERLRLEVAWLRASRKRLALAAEAERREIERALHEGVQQELVALAADLELADGMVDADPVAAKALLAEAGHEAQRAIEAARGLADRIHPPLIETGGLRAALRSVAAIADIPIRIDVAAGTTCPPEIASTVYFCCVEVLAHVGAGPSVTMSLSSEHGTLDFEIVADGDLDPVGLPLRDRVEALGGRLTIGSGSDGRTRVSGSFPLVG